MGFHQTAENLIGIGKILTISVIEMLFRIVAIDNLYSFCLSFWEIGVIFMHVMLLVASNNFQNMLKCSIEMMFKYQNTPKQY